MEQTFLMVKPDGVKRNLIGEIINRFERKEFKLVGAKLMTISNDLAENHYSEHEGKPFFDELIEFITSGPVFAMTWEGQDIIKISRNMIGATDPKEAAPGTIRGDFATILSNNIIHGSDSLESANREVNLFFNNK